MQITRQAAARAILAIIETNNDEQFILESLGLYGPGTEHFNKLNFYNKNFLPVDAFVKSIE